MILFGMIDKDKYGDGRKKSFKKNIEIIFINLVEHVK
jgi:hypothetical protein